MSREQFANVMMSMSSAGGESLQEIWKILDEEVSVQESLHSTQWKVLLCNLYFTVTPFATDFLFQGSLTRMVKFTALKIYT